MGEPTTIAAKLARWLDSPPGNYARAWQQRQVDAMVSNAFGYHAIQIGLPHWDLLQANRIPYKWHTGICLYQHQATTVAATAAGSDANAPAQHTAASNGNSPDLICIPEQLPFTSQSIDLLVLPHTLETCADPHQVLREVERVLMPEGRVVITGFNPFSLWGLRESIPGLALQLPVPVPAQVSLIRLKDWFKLLSFEIDRGAFGAYVPLCASSTWLQRWAFMDQAGARWWPVAGALYAVAATKRVAGLRLVGPAWRKPRAYARRASVTTAAKPYPHTSNNKTHE